MSKRSQVERTWGGRTALRVYDHNGRPVQLLRIVKTAAGATWRAKRLDEGWYGETYTIPVNDIYFAGPGTPLLGTFGYADLDDWRADHSTARAR